MFSITSLFTFALQYILTPHPNWYEWSVVGPLHRRRGVLLIYKCLFVNDDDTKRLRSNNNKKKKPGKTGKTWTPLDGVRPTVPLNPGYGSHLSNVVFGRRLAVVSAVCQQNGSRARKRKLYFILFVLSQWNEEKSDSWCCVLLQTINVSIISTRES